MDISVQIGKSTDLTVQLTTGSQGLSAYEVAVKDGYIGSETDWLIYWRGGQKGDTGEQGLQGLQGIQGELGNTGAKGDTGVQGIQGLKGDIGPQGAKGNTGEQGIQGEKGNTGTKGDTGNTGSQGIQGIQGTKGDTGNTGTQGEAGVQGVKGDTGNTGAQGIPGNTGATGIGIKGDKGDTGNIGIQGEAGLSSVSYTASCTGVINSLNSVFTTDMAYTQLQVYINGILCSPGTYTYSGTTLTFSSPPAIKSIIGLMGFVYACLVSETVGAKGDTGLQGIQGIQGIQGVAGATGIQGLQGNVGATGAKGDTGIQGVKGDTGTQGATGPKGDIGLTGLQGVTGATGSIGPKGDTGNIGAAGAAGLQGAKGDAGAPGIDGLAGTNGLKGDTGLTGQAGTNGTAGIKGDTGLTGLQGATGTAGADGAKGDTGIQGAKGDKGDTGVQGIQGIKGDTGLTGAKGDTGTNGIQGEKGDTGSSGAAGIQGNPGSAGADGATGIQGLKGDTGTTGLQGIQGIKGDAGTNGSQGIQGLTGSQGLKGDTGATGSQGIQGIQGVKGDTGLQGSSGGGSTLITEGALIVSAVAKSTPIDADIFGFADSADSNLLKKLTWTNIKSTLKTYFDTLYPAETITTIKAALGIASLSTYKVVATDDDGDLTTSIVTLSELQQLSGVTSPIQSQIDALSSSGSLNNTQSIINPMPATLVGVINPAKSFSFATQIAASCQGIYFSSDGLKMYSANSAAHTLFQYTLSTAWDISTAAYSTKSYIVPQVTALGDFNFSSDGTKLYCIQNGAAMIYQYTLSTAWDITTATYAAKSMNISGQAAAFITFCLASDGTKVYASTWSTSTAVVYQYTLSTPWDLSTAAYASKSKSLSQLAAYVIGIHLVSDGTTNDVRLFAVKNTTGVVYQYTLGTAGDISTANYDNLSYATTFTNESDLFISPDGSKMYVINAAAMTGYEYYLCNGNISAIQPVRASNYKKVLVYLNSLAGVCTYTFPVPFVKTPMGFSAAMTAKVTALSNTSITITGTGLTDTGFVELTGY